MHKICGRVCTFLTRHANALRLRSRWQSYSPTLTLICIPYHVIIVCKCCKQAFVYLLPHSGWLYTLARCPTPREMHAFAAPDLSSFINRKGYYAVVVLAACKANLEFVFFSAKHTGSTNDVVAIQGCEGGRILLGTATTELPMVYKYLIPYFTWHIKGRTLLEDQAFICTDTLFTPC
jgi:hypothetical protein